MHSDNEQGQNRMINESESLWHFVGEGQCLQESPGVCQCHVGYGNIGCDTEVHSCFLPGYPICCALFSTCLPCSASLAFPQH